MDRIEKIKNIIYQWRQKFKTRENINYITSRRANRNFINMLKGKRNVNRFRRRRKTLSFPIPTAPPYVAESYAAAAPYAAPTPSAPPMVSLRNVVLEELPH